MPKTLLYWLLLSCGLTLPMAAYADKSAGKIIQLGIIGPETGNPRCSTPMGMSADGKVVVGWSETNSKQDAFQQAFRWTAETGMQPLMPNNKTQSKAVYISADGKTIWGYQDAEAADTSQAESPFFWWNADSGFHYFSSENRLHPYYEMQTALFHNKKPPVQAPSRPLFDFPFDYKVKAISEDGQMILGEDQANRTGFIWTKKTGTLALNANPADIQSLITRSGWQNKGKIDSSVWISGASTDGRTIIGTVFLSAKTEDYNWTFIWRADASSKPAQLSGLSEAKGTMQFDFSHAEMVPSSIDVISGDGQVVIGYAFAKGRSDWFRWSATSGMQWLNDWLREQGIAVTEMKNAPTFIGHVAALSYDGSALIGRGAGRFNCQAFVAYGKSANKD